MSGTGCDKRTTSPGFTLVELMIALAISAFVALVGYQGISVAVTASQSLAEQSRRLADIELGLGLLEEDIRRMVARPVRNELGVLEPVLAGGFSAEALLTFTRAGWTNPQGLRRSELARIEYRLEGSSLQRRRWLVLDRVGFEEGLQEMILLEGVESIQVEFLDPNIAGDAGNPAGLVSGTSESREFVPSWVPDWNSRLLAPGIEQPLPLAVRITINLENFGRVSRVVPIVNA